MHYIQNCGLGLQLHLCTVSHGEYGERQPLIAWREVLCISLGSWLLTNTTKLLLRTTTSALVGRKLAMGMDSTETYKVTTHGWSYDTIFHCQQTVHMFQFSSVVAPNISNPFHFVHIVPNELEHCSIRNPSLQWQSIPLANCLYDTQDLV